MQCDITQGHAGFNNSIQFTARFCSSIIDPGNYFTKYMELENDVALTNFPSALGVKGQGQPMRRFRRLGWMMGILSNSLSILFLFETCKCQDSAINISPNLESYVAAEDSPIVNFTCTTTGAVPISLTALVDGAEPTVDVENTRQIQRSEPNATVRTLSIAPIALNNGTEISCLAVFNFTYIRAAVPVTLYVQGILLPPSNLRIVSPMDALQMLTWTAPFTQDILSVDPDISGYRVCYEFPFQAVVCTITQDEFFRFINVDFTVTLTVSAINVVGESEVATFTRPACSQVLSSGT